MRMLKLLGKAWAMDKAVTPAPRMTTGGIVVVNRE
jgi:hypothetical protein